MKKINKNVIRQEMYKSHNNGKNSAIKSLKKTRKSFKLNSDISHQPICGLSLKKNEKKSFL